MVDDEYMLIIEHHVLVFTHIVNKQLLGWGGIRLERKTVLLTGASGGIGFEVAKRFAKRGYRLVLVALEDESLEAAADYLQALTDVTVIEKDLTQPNAAKEVYEHVARRGIHVDILINSAGVGLEGVFPEVPLDGQIRMIQLNIVALTELTHAFAKGMMKRRYGRIVNLSSIAGPLPTPYMAVYGATKAYVYNFSQALQSELQGAGDIVVTTVIPGPTKTPFTKTSTMNRLDGVMNKMGVSPESVADAIVDGILNRRVIIIPNMRYKWMLLLGKLAPSFLVRRLMLGSMKG